ncbi:hypothetical protein [Candidatus Tisiphia endosymbiont of Piscicola geometra]|uniref:hypothetical protein n=1 Tax=Candidatus Tisiphia endosymbiont of Piscicola geometra TaxID=3066273 RepID=UPI00312CA358
MGRINKHSNGNWVNQHRKSQGKFLEEQDIEALLFSKNGNNIQEKNTPNIDDLPNYALNLLEQNSIDPINIIEPINGAIPHTPIGALLPILTALTALSSVSPTTVPFQKAISTGTPNGLLSGVTSAIGKMPILFDATPATSKNHAQSKKLTKHSDDSSLSRGKRAVGDGLILHNTDGNIILGNNGQKLTFSHHLDIDILKEQLENSNITELCLWEVPTVRQKAQEIGKILRGSNVKVLSILHGSIKGIDFGTMLTGTEVTRLNLAYNGIGDEKAIGFIESLKKGSTKVKALDISSNNMSDEGVNDIIPKLVGTQIIEMDVDRGIKRKILKKLLKVLKENRQVNKESTSTIKSSTTEKESSTEEDHTTNNKREKRDIHTTDETLPKQETTVLTTDVSSTTTTESTISSTSTTAKKETTVPTTEKSSTSTTESTTPTTVSTSTTESTTPTTVSTSTTESTTPTTVSTSTTESTTPTTVSTSTTEPTTNVKSSTTTTKSTAFSAGKTTTPKKNLTEKPEPIAADVVVDSITEKHTPKESNPNNPASSTMSIGEISGLISSIVTIIGVGGGVAIYAIKKLCGGVSRLGHNALALADLAESDDRLDNNEETSSLTGVVIVDDNADI